MVGTPWGAGSAPAGSAQTLYLHSSLFFEDSRDGSTRQKPLATRPITMTPSCSMSPCSSVLMNTVPGFTTRPMNLVLTTCLRNRGDLPPPPPQTLPQCYRGTESRSYYELCTIRVARVVRRPHGKFAFRTLYYRKSARHFRFTTYFEFTDSPDDPGDQVPRGPVGYDGNGTLPRDGNATGGGTGKKIYLYRCKVSPNLVLWPVFGRGEVLANVLTKP
jgi:hypothetical protein